MADDDDATSGEMNGAALAIAEPDVVAEGDVESPDASADTEEVETPADKPPRSAPSPVRSALVIGLAMLALLSSLAGWLGYHAYQSFTAKQQRDLFLQVGRQGAVNLTTIDYTRADADVQRVLDSSTGTFYDDFQKRSPAFVEVVKQAESKSEGTVTDAGIESSSGDSAQVLVTVAVQASNIGARDQPLRHWRMRITVQDVGNGQAKVSNVGFVP